MPIPGGISYEQLRHKINNLLNPGEPWHRFVRELYEDRVIFEDEDGQLYEADYTVTADGDVELGEFRPVKIEYVAARFAVALKDGTVPPEIQLLPAGRFKTHKGEFELTPEAAEKIVADFEAAENDIVVDYEHQSLKGGEAPAAGWVKKLINKGRDGLWAVVEWTPRAVEYLKNREYRYLSPAFYYTKKGLIKALINAGLTNTPAIDGMVPVVNKLDVKTHKKEEGKMLKKLLKLLGLKDDATEEQALERVQAMKASHDGVEKLRADLGVKPAEDFTVAVMALKDTGQAPAHKEVLTALGLKEGASLSEVKGTIVALKEGSGHAGDLAKRVAELESKEKEKAAEDLVAAAMEEGKVTPAEKDAMLKWAGSDPEGFKAYAKVAMKKVHIGEHAGGDGPGGGGDLGDVQLAVNTALGISEETFKKHNPKKD